MNAPVTPPSTTAVSPAHSTPLTLRLIAGLALLKALLFGMTGLGIGRLVQHGVEDTLTGWLSAVHLDPTGDRLHHFIASVADLDQNKLRLIGFGAFFYTALYLIEGIGLWLDRTWAEWLTVVGSSLLLPIELYELAEGVSLVKASVFIVNVAVVVYLLARLRRKHLAKTSPKPGLVDLPRPESIDP